MLPGHSLLFFLLLCFSLSAEAQGFLRLVENPRTGIYQRMAQFSNGDILVGDLSVIPLSGGTQNEIYFMRLDACGEIIWAKAYPAQNIFHSFDQIHINEADEFFVFGSISLLGKEVIYVAKFNEFGDEMAYRRFDGAGFDNLTYSMDYYNGRVMISGTLLDFANDGNSYIAVLDDDLELQWSRKYVSDPAYGETISTTDGGYLHQVKNYFIKVDSEGSLEWSQRISTQPDFIQLSSALEVSDGYIYATYTNGAGWFFKLDKSGNTLWISDKYTSFSRIANMQMLPDERIMAFYTIESPGGNRPAYLILETDGEISTEFHLETDYPLDTDFITGAIANQDFIYLFGNADRISGRPLTNADFILQFAVSPDAFSPECFSWLNTETRIANDEILEFAPLPIEVRDAPLETSVADVFAPEEADLEFTDICGTEKDSSFVRTDTLMACYEDWVINLPPGDYVWEPNVPGLPPKLREPGLYRAQERNCTEYRVFEFFLEKTECDCELFLPNAFSPNNDGVNDFFAVEGRCDFTKTEMRIFDRWGGLIFKSEEPDFRWTGEDFPEGVYIAVFNYERLNVNGERELHQIAGDLTLVR